MPYNKALHEINRYTRTPILDDGSGVVQWWSKISPAERLRVVNEISDFPVPDLAGPTYTTQRILIPDNQAELEALEKFRNLRPEQRLSLLKQFHQE